MDESNEKRQDYDSWIDSLCLLPREYAHFQVITCTISRQMPSTCWLNSLETFNK
jgi:hypothetical protein